MRKNHFIFRGLLFAGLLIVLTSSVPINTKNNDELKAKEEKAKLLVDEALKDGHKLSNKELFDLASEVKGRKLNFADKVALKAFNKKNSKLEASSQYGGGGKSQLVALLLVIFVGTFGIHRFYLGYIGIGIIQLLTLGGLGIWALIDLIRIAIGDLTPKDGDYDKTF
ncbi:MAG: hypothetical protein FYV88_0320 [Bacteroidetes bacterium]|nr:hypothetical protein [Bacteroidota bacterium]